MASTLRLILERCIAVQPKANKLSLPLDRNLGDITRYKYVLANTLPLRMERMISEQPSANALKLGMMQPLSTIAPPLYFISNSLPLPLTVATSEQPAPNVLPLGMTRRLGTIFGAPVIVPPVDNNDVAVTVNAVAGITPTASAIASVTIDNAVSVSVTATANLMPVADASVIAEPVSVGITINAVAVLNPTARASASYDANNPRLAMLDVASDMQNAKLQGIDKRGQFENNRSLKHGVSANWQQSRLIGAGNQAQFEANEKLATDSQLLFEQSKLMGGSSQQLYESQLFINSKAQLKTEAARRISYSNWYSFEAMAKRQIERVISGENGVLVTDTFSTFNEYSYLIGQRKELRQEFARLPFSKLRYVPPPLSQTVILKKQEIIVDCGIGDINVYAYNDELALPIHRRMAGRALSSNLALMMNRKRGVLSLPADVANALPNRPCNKATLGVNPTLDMVMCQPKVFGKASGIAIHSQAVLNATAYLQLAISDKADFDGQGVIFVTNSVSLVRSDDGREIKMLGFSVGIDSNSYTWSFSATVPLSELSKVDTALEQQIGVEFTCNGNLWRFILDSCDDSISFGESSLTIKGKSRAMLLAHPYASQRGFKFDTAMSARQIADAELNRNGVPSGFTLDWQLAGVNGWDIPANTYSYTGRTPINSLQWIAEAAGGFINTDMSADVLHVLAYYPIPSWEWAAQTPSINLTQSLITSRSRGRVNKPAYNGVTIYGENDNGIGALIKRTGTSGGYQPPMVTSDLMTAQAAAISRGKMILSDTGDIGNIGISMPLVADIGVLKPSTLIGVNDGEQWVGMVRGTTITGRLSSNRALEIDQSIDVERHFDKG